jgi:hypothetical protein
MQGGSEGAGCGDEIGEFEQVSGCGWSVGLNVGFVEKKAGGSG